MTEWIAHHRSAVGKGRYGREWDTVPAVSVFKTGITYNQLFEEKYIGDSIQVLLYFAKDEPKIGLKIVPYGNEIPEAYSISLQKEKRNKFTQLIKLQEWFPNTKGFAYKALEVGAIIEIALTPENRTK